MYKVFIYQFISVMIPNLNQFKVDLNSSIAHPRKLGVNVFPFGQVQVGLEPPQLGRPVLKHGLLRQGSLILQGLS